MTPFQRAKTENAELNRVQDAIARFTRGLELNPVLDGVLLESKALTRGANLIPHGLTRKLRGWQTTRIRARTDDAPVTFTVSGWTTTPGFSNPSHRLGSDGYVDLDGLIQITGAVAAGTVLARLPYAPGANMILRPFGNNSGTETNVRVDVQPDGDLVLNQALGAGTNYVSFAGIRFKAVLPHTPAPFLYDAQDDLSASQQQQLLKLVSPAAMTVDLWVF